MPGLVPVNDQMRAYLDGNGLAAPAPLAGGPNDAAGTDTPDALASPQPAVQPDEAQAAAPAPAEQPAGLIHINEATMEQWMELPGIGEVKARAIVEYRQQAGGFRSVDELTKVKGIGAKTLEKLKPLITGP